MGITVTVADGNRLQIHARHRSSLSWKSSVVTTDEDAENILVGLVTRTAEKITHITLSHGIAVVLSHNKFKVATSVTDTGIQFKEFTQTSNVFFRSDKDLAFFLLTCDPSTL